MPATPPPDPALVVVVRPGRRAGRVRRWLRQLVPTAMLLGPPMALPPEPLIRRAVILESDEIESPMALAAALARGPGDEPGR